MHLDRIRSVPEIMSSTPKREDESGAEYLRRIASIVNSENPGKETSEGYIRKVYYEQGFNKPGKWVEIERRLNRRGEVTSSTQKLIADPLPIPEGHRIDGLSTYDPQTRQWVKTRHDGTINFDVVIDGLKERCADYVPPKFELKYPSHSDNCAILNLYDCHLDKIGIRSQVRKETTFEDNLNQYREAVDTLLSQVSHYKPEMFIFPVGNDLFHTNDTTGKTKRGTQLDYYLVPEEAYQAICMLIIEQVSKVAQIAPVKVIGIKGNHDEDKVATLMFWLSKFFENHDGVDVDYSRYQRKYVHYGSCMFGFAHGDKEKQKIIKIPYWMATEEPEMWAATKFRKFYCGDLHHNFEYKFMKIKDYPGVEVEFLRGLAPNDRWHHDEGYIGIPKSAECNVWNKERGNIADLKVHF